MRRPLFAAALFLVIIAALRLGAGGADGVPPGYISTEGLEADRILLVTGQVYQKDEKSVYLKSVVLLESDALGRSAAQSRQSIPIKENLICETENALEIPLGTTAAFRGEFAPYSHATNPGEFDSALYYRTLKVGGRLRKAVPVALGEHYWHVREALFQLKLYFKERLYRIFPEKEAAVMSALLLGDKKELDSDLKELYKRNGILHILSISSLHITIIGMSVYTLLRKAGMPVIPAAAAGSVLLSGYGCMTGFGVSACRAIGMYGIKMLGEMAGRTYDMLTGLGVMAAVMVAGNPYYLQNSGFLLSFTSVLGIALLSPALVPEQDRGRAAPGKEKEKGFRRLAGELRAVPGNVGKSLCESLFVSLSITLATLPIQLYYYYEVPVYSVFLNLFVIPFMKPMMITGLLAMLVPGLGILGCVDYVILRGYEILCGIFDRLPFHVWNPGCPRIWQIAVYYVLLSAAAGLRIYCKKERQEGTEISGRIRMGKRISVPVLFAAVLLFAIGMPRENRVIFLDVGQGDCILVQTSSGRNYLFDCGSSSRKKIGKYILIPFLKYCGIGKLDAVFLSHPDADHVNGAAELLETGGDHSITVGQLLLPAIEEGAREEQWGKLIQAAEQYGRDRPVPVGYLGAGDGWECKGARFPCLHPAYGFGAGDVNGYSQCFLAEFSDSVSGQGWSLLLTGDVQEKGESMFLEELQRREIRKVTVLKAAHHGSRNSTPAAFLDQVAPAVTVISSGRDNRYGHPHEELLQRLEDSGTHIVQTARSGAITVSLRRGRLRVSGYCEQSGCGDF